MSCQYYTAQYIVDISNIMMYTITKKRKEAYILKNLVTKGGVTIQFFK